MTDDADVDSHPPPDDADIYAVIPTGVDQNGNIITESIPREFNYYNRNSKDNTLAMLARLFTELQLDSFTIAGPNNSWTVVAREG